MLYLTFKEDEVYQSNNIYYNNKKMDLKKIDQLKEIHPFMRNIYVANYN